MYGHKAAFDQVMDRDYLHFVTLRSHSAFGIDFTLLGLQENMMTYGRM